LKEDGEEKSVRQFISKKISDLLRAFLLAAFFRRGLALNSHGDEKG
jgi:hypothetical protein